MDNEREGGGVRRNERIERGRGGEETEGRYANVEMDDVEEERSEDNRNGQERGSVSGAEGGRKRNLEERSPGVHDGKRVNKRRVNEFEMGRLFEDIVKKMGKDIDSLIEKAARRLRRS